MSYYRTKKINGHRYVYEMQNYRDASGRRRQRMVRYVGPVNPIYGGKGPASVHAERARRGPNAPEA